MPRRTHKQIAEEHGVTMDQLRYAKDRGANIYDNDALAAFLRGKRPKSDVPGPPAPAVSGDLESIEDIENILRSPAIDRHTVTVYKEKLLALKNAISVRREMGQLIERGQVQEDITRICSAARAELIKLSNDLPPRLAGLGEAQMQKVLRTSIHEILTRLADDANELYEQPETT